MEMAPQQDTCDDSIVFENSIIICLFRINSRKKEHTWNKADSIHPLNERRKKGRNNFHSEQRIMLVKMAKASGNPMK